MISFEMTAEQLKLKNDLRKLAREKMQKAALALDAKPPAPVDPEYRRIVAGMGLTRMLVPKEFGGDGADRVTIAIATEELGYGCPGWASIFGATIHTVSALLIGGSRELQAEYLPLLLSPEGNVASFMITEEKGGSDTSHYTAQARLEGDSYVINGKKVSIIAAPDAAFYVVWASTDISKGRAGISAFVIPKNTPGLLFCPLQRKSGLRGAPTCDVILKDVRVPRSNLLGCPGGGYVLLAETLDRGRAFFGAICVGLAAAAFDESMGYATRRMVKNHPIIDHQAISFPLSDIATKIDASRLLVWRACRLMDLKQDYSKESSMAKLSSSVCAYEAAGLGLQIMGISASSENTLMDKLHRDAALLRIVEGTNIIQEMIIASQQ